MILLIYVERVGITKTRSIYQQLQHLLQQVVELKYQNMEIMVCPHLVDQAMYLNFLESNSQMIVII